VNHIEAKKIRPPTKEVMNDCIFFGFRGLEVQLVLVRSGNGVPGKIVGTIMMCGGSMLDLKSEPFFP